MEQRFKIYFTSDTHGHIFPVNYAAGCPENSGLLNLAAQVEKAANEMEAKGYRLVSFVAMPSAKGVLVFHREGEAPAEQEK